MSPFLSVRVDAHSALGLVDADALFFAVSAGAVDFVLPVTAGADGVHSGGQQKTKPLSLYCQSTSST